MNIWKQIKAWAWDEIPQPSEDYGDGFATYIPPNKAPWLRKAVRMLARPWVEQPLATLLAVIGAVAALIQAFR